jgi:hypothetical protein
MIASLALAAALWPATVTQTCQPGQETLIAGIAKNTEGDFLYCEMVARSASDKLHIQYTRGNQLFATKELFYGHSVKMPDVLQTDSRSGEVRKANLVDNQLILQYQPNSHKKLAKVTLTASEAEVVDAGFDNYIREHWSEIDSGKIAHIDFASIAHLKVLPLRIRKQPLATCSHTPTEGFCFVVEIDNSILRLLLGNIKLLYDTQHRLQKFEGVVNLNNDKEGNQKAIIHYYYQSDYLPKSDP